MTAVDYGPRRPAAPRYPVTRRQREALLWIARGHTLAGAGRQMGVTDNGVNGLLRLAYRKLGARSAAHAVALAMARGLITAADITEPPHGRTAAPTAPATTTPKETAA